VLWLGHRLHGVVYVGNILTIPGIGGLGFVDCAYVAALERTVLDSGTSFCWLESWMDRVRFSSS
jgi:hypothetical protein